MMPGLIMLVVVAFSGLLWLWYQDRDLRTHYQQIANNIASLMEEMFYGFYPNWKYSAAISCKGNARRTHWLWGGWVVYLTTLRDSDVTLDVKHLVPDRARRIRNSLYPQERFTIQPIYVTRKEKGGIHDAPQYPLGRRWRRRFSRKDHGRVRHHR